MEPEILGAGPPTFGTVDNVIFLLSIAIGAFIGIYFAYFAPKGSNAEADYLVGDRNMGIFPIVMSLAASVVSAITLIGYPAEVRVYGSQIMYSNLGSVAAMFLYNEQVLPVVHGLQGLSLNEYFLHRFDRRVRTLGSVLFAIFTVGYLPVVIYVPALAYEQVTGNNVHLVTPIVCLVCIFYTTIGGIKAVVWTDVIQMISMILCVAIVAIKGTLDVGGFSEVWHKNVATGRIEPPFFHFDPTVRHSIFSVVIGFFAQHVYFMYLSQGIVQRHQALRTLQKAKKAVWWSTGLMICTWLLSGYFGLILAAKYFDCDPVVIQFARTRDQVVPMFVMESIGHIPGLAGLYVAGLFSASLSSMSTALNTMSAVFLEDWIRGFNLWDPTEVQSSMIMKGSVVFMGALTVALVFVVEKLGMVFQLSVSLVAISTGPMLVIFITGLFMPWVTHTGALVGAAAGLLSLAPIMIPAQVYLGQGLLHFPAKPLSVEGCAQMYNVSQEFVNSFKVPEETLWPMGPTRGDVSYVFRLSYLWYIPISVICGLAAAALFTVFVSRTNLKRVDRRLIAPFARRWLPKSADDSPNRGNHVLIADFEVQQP